MRGLNEIIESGIMDIEQMPDYTLLTDDDFIKRLPEILHTASFLSYVALKSKSASVDEIVGDEGVIHELTHLLADTSGCHKKSLNCIRDLIKQLQKSALGFYHPV